MQKAPKTFLTARQLAKRFQVDYATVLDWAKAKKIPAIRISHKIIRFDFEAVLQALEKRNARIKKGPARG